MEGWNAVARFRGVTVSETAKLVGAPSQASTVDFQSFDENYDESGDIESAPHPQTVVVYAKDEQLLSFAYNAPTLAEYEQKRSQHGDRKEPTNHRRRGRLLWRDRRRDRRRRNR